MIPAKAVKNLAAVLEAPELEVDVEVEDELESESEPEPEPEPDFEPVVEEDLEVEEDFLEEEEDLLAHEVFSLPLTLTFLNSLQEMSPSDSK